ncbi:alpha/beta hydrolase family protein [Snuella sedimenti]|uniref:Alpha/beta hydrolase n=1 Tax=Snuella sedimenti TaxID=2798802 RepID=A0A8J7LPR4_9FLAO|nr:alpha/beta hydrolase [Snuella sedimenti]MBJ6369718.1 alpha/beta hydrolase [Snuella sedimenti]
MKLKLLILLFLCIDFTNGQEKQVSVQNLSINKFIDGTLILPPDIEKPNLAIIIGGSGPTDRNGNQNLLKNNALKKLAEGISNNDIATFRYDKRVVKQIRQGIIDKDIMFDDFVTDAISVIDYFKSTKQFNKIYIIGHSQGSLVGMLAAKNRADGFISIAGAGQSIDKVIMEQLEKTAPMFTEDAKKVFQTLSKGETTENYPTALTSIFNKDIQAFMANWMQYDPKEEIKNLQFPILIINGTKDLQVPEEEATILKEASNHASLVIIDKMNHVLVPIEGGDLENSKSYNESFRALSPKLVDAIIDFINKFQH